MGEGEFFVGVNAVAGWVDDGGCDEDEEVFLFGGKGFGAEEAAEEWDVAKDGYCVFCFGDGFGDEAAEDDGLAIPDDG